MAHSSHSDFAGYRCNLCGKQLEEGWVTGCWHTFCYEHSKEWFDKREDCPICRDGAVKLVRMDVSEAWSRKRTTNAMVGMNPSDMIEAFEHAMQFWTHHHSVDAQRQQKKCVDLAAQQKTIQEMLDKKLHGLEDACGKVKEEQQELKRRLEFKRNEISKMREHYHRMCRIQAEAEDKLASVQQQLADNPRRALGGGGGGLATRSPGLARRSPGSEDRSARGSRRSLHPEVSRPFDDGRGSSFAGPGPGSAEKGMHYARKALETISGRTAGSADRGKEQRQPGSGGSGHRRPATADPLALLFSDKKFLDSAKTRGILAPQRRINTTSGGQLRRKRRLE